MKTSIALCVGLCLSIPQVSQARLTDVICDDSSRLKHQLEHVMGATQQARGVRDPEALIEIWIVPRNGDWTIVQNYANGTSCIVAMGEHWEALTPEPA
ncbi:MAG: hypothetical protein AAFP85_19710 [Pseudomonadota bacterium]